MPLFQPHLVIGELGQLGVSRFVRASLDDVERVRSPVWSTDNRRIEAVRNLEESFDGKVRGFEAAGMRQTGNGYVKVGIRWRCKADGGDIEGERRRVIGLFHDGCLRVKA